MVVGNGMLARTFSHFAEDESKIIFASGVSNSGETIASEFQRELDLIKSFAGIKSQVIYFSTVSVHDRELANTPYVMHKLLIEKLVKETFINYLILRLPIVVGKTTNPNTLTNFIFNKIKSGEQITVFKNACRFLMDIEDIKTIISKMIQTGQYKNMTLDINFENPIKSENLISIFEKVVQKKANKSYADKGGCYSPNNQEFISFINSIDFVLPPNYDEEVINKYYGSQS